MIALPTLGLVVLLLKPLFMGETQVKGTILSISRGPFQDCIKVSKTTQGETVIVSSCVNYDLPDTLKVGQIVSYTFKASPVVFMDKITFNEL
jgi:hypothetical protein